MSLYAEIQGTIGVPLEAKELLMSLDMARWIAQEARDDELPDGDLIDMEVSADGIVLTLGGYYRNLGRVIDQDLIRLVQRYPSTWGSLWLSSTDGCLVCEAFEAKGDGKVWRRILGPPEEVCLAEVETDGTKRTVVVPVAQTSEGTTERTEADHETDQ